MWISAVIFLLCLISGNEFSIIFRDVNDEIEDNSQNAETYFISQMLDHVSSLGLNTIRNLPSLHSNVILSPLNIYSCLEILELGAEGETKQEISRLLGPGNSNLTARQVLDSLKDISRASAVFLDEKSTVKEEFVLISSTQYQAPVIKINVSDGLASSQAINSWVVQHTNGTIQELIQGPLDADTKAVIITALFFKGKWQYPFSPLSTYPDHFVLNANSTIKVPFMTVEATLPVLRSRSFHAVGFPYEGNDLTMYVILPRQQGMDALKKVFYELTPKQLQHLPHNCTSEAIVATIPKFKIDTKLRLKESLKKQGVVSMFNPEKANFNNFLEPDNALFISEVFHNVHFEIDEEGTTASAISAATFTKSSKFVFYANRPFIFVVTHVNGLVLFNGIIIKPDE